MTREEKDILLQDLSARLPYGVMVQDDMGRTYKLNLGNAYLADLCYGNGGYIETPIKPYLRPMSSMTDKEKRDYIYLCEMHLDRDADDNVTYYYFDTVESIDWLNRNMFDFRGLIPKGRAIAVNENNNPYEKK